MRLLEARSTVAAARIVHRQLVGRRFTRRCSSRLARGPIATHTMMLQVHLLVPVLIIHLPFVHPHQGKKSKLLFILYFSIYLISFCAYYRSINSFSVLYIAHKISNFIVYILIAHSLQILMGISHCLPCILVFISEC